MSDIQSSSNEISPVIEKEEEFLTPRTETMNTSRSELSKSQETNSTEDDPNEIVTSNTTFDSDMEKQADALYATAITSQKLYKFDEAIINLQTALQLYIKIDGRNDKNVANTLNSLGNVFFDAERYEESLLKYQEALDVCKAYTGEISMETASVYVNMSRVLFKLERFQEALDINTEAINIKKQIPSTSTLVPSDKPKKFVPKPKETKGTKCSIQ